MPDPGRGVTPSGDDVLDLFSSVPAEPESVAEPESRTWGVSELNRHLRRSLEDAFPPLWVSGEIGSWTRARSGHCYFSLKDDRSQIRCVMWRRDAAGLPLEPEEGMTVRALGRVTLYEARGELQLQVEALEGEGEDGLWKLAFERLRKRLEEEGLLDPARKRRLPAFPRTVGVVTSPTGAAFRDILSVVGRRAPWTRILLRGARVQGEGAALEIARAIQVLAASGEPDVIIIGRGGGSVEDLWAFNEEPVARAVAACPVPVVSAVGHETDVTISDLVADLRAPTPSAAAEAVVQDGAMLQGLLEEARMRLARALRDQVERKEVRLRGVRSRLGPGVSSILRPLYLRQDRATERLEGAIRRLISARRERMAALAGQVNALSPLSTLQRGYAVPLDHQGRVLRSVEDFGTGTRFRLRVADGGVPCRVEGDET
ncbi:MAG: exodeoxyribonuclease VII large subunit [Gemmatimonadales bacterium]|nr:MAG: exodeoxyribonuclease VII large subunit [Gemmatimonadales bacterium]